MSLPLNVVAVSGNVAGPSRTASLTHALLDELQQHLPLTRHVVELESIATALGTAPTRQHASDALSRQLARIESAELLLVVSPVYRGSYPGLLKHLFDLVDQHALIDVPVLLAATGGSERHALMIDYQLRPLFSFFQALTLPVGVYASEADFEDYQVTRPALHSRIAPACERAPRTLGSAEPTLKRIA
ncbi:FMN reductase [Xanthomonas cannabis]|uniref:FMN reductase n=1 Tax=Xanthomonas cannabis TaxID=1885674 RepID=UPI0033B9CF8E